MHRFQATLVRLAGVAFVLAACAFAPRPRPASAPPPGQAVILLPPPTDPAQAPATRLCAVRAQHLFNHAGIPAVIVTNGLETLDLRSGPLLVLPFLPEPTTRQLRLLARHLRHRGRLLIFGPSDPRLARRLGFALLPAVTSPEPWNTIAGIPTSTPGLPAYLPHLATQLQPVRANHPDAITLARWQTPDGMTDYNLPAVAVSPRGIWFSHSPPNPTPSAIQFLLAALAASDPARRPALAAFLTESARRDAEATALLASSPPPPREIRAVAALPIDDRLREETMSLLASNGIHIVYEHLGTGGLAHYRSDPSIPRSNLGERRSRHFLPRALEFAHAHGLALHAWIACGNLDSPASRAALLALLSDLARQGVDGIHLDGLVPPSPRDPADLTAYLAEASRTLRTLHPGLHLSASIPPLSPSAPAAPPPAWAAWLRDGHLDTLCPILATSDARLYDRQLRRILEFAPDPSRILPVVVATDTPAPLDSLAAARLILAARARHTAGFVLYRYDSELRSRLLPALSLPPRPSLSSPPPSSPPSDRP